MHEAFFDGEVAASASRTLAAVAYMRDIMTTAWVYVVQGAGCSQPIYRQRGVMQGCPAAPTIFLWVLDDVLRPLRKHWARTGR